jgi:hypothetical protein
MIFFTECHPERSRMDLTRDLHHAFSIHRMKYATLELTTKAPVPR